MNPQLKLLRDKISAEFADSQPDLTTGIKIGELSSKDKSRALFNACRTIIFAKQINDGMAQLLKLQNCPVDGQ